MKSQFILASMVGMALLATLPGLAQDPNAPGPPSAGGWRKFQPPAQPNDPPPQAATNAPDPSQAPPPAPSVITLPPGTWITVRVNEPLSSDHNQAGDAFTGTLLEPIVSRGLLIARRGQTVTGVVSEAKKAGRVSGTSRLGLELTEIGLADGRQVQVRTKLMERRGNTSYGRDAAAIGATTATGAAIGAGVNGGVGAGVGAAAGVVASTIGVLLTRGRATVVYPETPLTFGLDAPLTIDNSEQAFQPASQRDYEQRVAAPPRRPAPRPPYYYGGYYPPYPYPYPYPYFYGPSLFFSYGGFYGRGFHRW